MVQFVMKSHAPRTPIAQNKKARFEYSIERTVTAGIALEGWEVKSLRAGKAQITDSYAIVKNAEVWLLGSQIIPLVQASTHIHPEQSRTRKLLLHKKEIREFIGLIKQKGYTLIPLKLHWHRNLVKLDLAIAKGKKQYDKRQTIKEREWERSKARETGYIFIESLIAMAISALIINFIASKLLIM